MRDGSYSGEFSKGHPGACVMDGAWVCSELERELQDFDIVSCRVHCISRFNNVFRNN